MFVDAMLRLETSSVGALYLDISLLAELGTSFSNRSTDIPSLRDYFFRLFVQKPLEG